MTPEPKPGDADSQRLFIALAIPDDLHAAVERVQSRLRYLSGASAIRWTRRGQLHLTLEFLGNVKTALIPGAIAALQNACAGEAPLKLALQNAGCFPSFSKPSVVWLDVTGEIKRLAEIQSRVRETARAFGDRLDPRAFSPHLTIGRVKNGCYKTARVFGKALEVESKKLGALGDWSAGRIHLIRSELTSDGAVYTELGHAELNEKDGRPALPLI